MESNGMGRVFVGEGQEREKGREGSKHKQTEPGLRGETGNTTWEDRREGWIQK